MNDSQKSAHRRTWDLIPWVLNGNASDAERREVERHVAGCPDCADELAFQRQLHTAMTASAPAPHDPSPALQRLWSRIDASESDRALAGSQAPRRVAVRSGWTRLLVAAVVVQAIGLSALVGIVSERPRSADYQTLSRPAAAPSRATIRLVPSPSLQFGQLRELLERRGLMVVESSGDGTILGVATRPGRPVPVAALLLQLRADPGVALAEPVVPAVLSRDAAAAASGSAAVLASPSDSAPASRPESALASPSDPALASPPESARESSADTAGAAARPEAGSGAAAAPATALPSASPSAPSPLPSASASASASGLGSASPGASLSGSPAMPSSARAVDGQ